MAEILMAVLIAATMMRLCQADGRGSPWAWGGVSLLVCLASLSLPWPLFRVVMAGFAVFVAMVVYNVLQANRRDGLPRIDRSGGKIRP